MPEPQIPGHLQGRPQEGRPGPVQPAGHRGYTVGPMFSPPAYSPSGNMSVNTAVPTQNRQAAGSFRSWHW
jgi:hypothetical protein